MKKVQKKESIRTILSDKKQSSFNRYKKLTVGNVSFVSFIKAELLLFFLSGCPGALGIFLRQKLYPFIFKACGKGVIIGKNCVFRHPSKVLIGNNVTIDDNCVVDARGTRRKGIVFEDKVICNRGTIIQSKGGDIIIGKETSIGGSSILVSWDGIEIGEACAIAAGCYLSAGNYAVQDVNKRFIDAEAYTQGPIIIEENVWIATRVTILDGVHIGKDSIVSAGAVVTKSVPNRSVVHGNPAKVVFKRR